MFSCRRSGRDGGYAYLNWPTACFNSSKKQTRSVTNSSVVVRVLEASLQGVNISSFDNNARVTDITR
jgi:hypothetical protein